MAIELSRYVGAFGDSPLARWRDHQPWELTTQASALVRQMLSALAEHEFAVTDEVAVHRTAIVEPGAILKAPLILGAGCFVAAGAYLRGGNWVGANCTLGPGTELKSSFVFAGAKLAHFNFVGDSIIGSAVNLEAGSVVCNYRNEREAKEILVRQGDELRRTGCEKFGAVLGDNCRIGANAVVAPGALLVPGTIVRRAELFDQELFTGDRI